jgi:2-hydroxy-6-oxonona-2,4-dienedioate hydrolase
VTCADPTPRARTISSLWTRLPSSEIHTRFVRRQETRRPSILLVHGLGLSSRYMVPTAMELSPDFDVYAPDLPGFGRSGKPDHVLDVGELAAALIAWMDALDLGRVVALGNSFGCQVIARMAILAPGRLERSILAGPTVDPRGRTTWSQAARLLRDVPWEPPSLLPMNVRDYLACGPGRLWKTCRLALKDAIEEMLPQMRLPTLVVRGARDPIVPQRWAEEAVRLLPEGHLEVIPGAGHAVNYNSPAKLARLVRKFLAA